MLGQALRACRTVWQRGGLVARAAACRHSQPHVMQSSLWASSQTQQQRPAVAAAAAAAGRWQQQRGLAGGRRRPVAQAKAASDDEEDMDDVEAIGDLGNADDFLNELEELEEQMGPELSTGGVEWGEKALAVVQQLLGSAEGELADIELFSFRAIPSSKRLDIRLDKTTDQYGSPSLDDVATFGRRFNAAYEDAVGEAAAGEVEIEVSSAGAERQVRVPGELQRFAELPMKVEYCREEDKVENKVLMFIDHDAAAAVTRWRLADVRLNRTAGKGRGLNRKQRDAVYELPLAAVRRVNLHIDF